MHRALLFIASISGALALGCKGCAEKQRPALETAEQPSGQPSLADEAKLNSRLGARKIAPGKQYAKNADGSVACGEDVDCFVVQAQTCTSAVLKNTQHTGAFGIDQRIEAEYRITGKDGGDLCKLARQISAVGISLMPALEEALRKQGKTADDIARMKEENELSLRKRNPKLLECSFDSSEILSVALDIAEGHPDPRPWRKACAEPEGAQEGAAPSGAPATNAAPKPAETH